MQIDRRIAALCLVAVVLGAAVSAKKSGDGDAKNASGVVKNETLEGTSELSESAAKLLALEKLTPRLEEGVPLFEKPQPLYYVKVNMADADFFLFELLGEEQIGTISVHVHSLDSSRKKSGKAIKSQVTDNTNIFYADKETLEEACRPGYKEYCILSVRISPSGKKGSKLGMVYTTSQERVLYLRDVSPLILPQPSESSGYTIIHFPSTVHKQGININMVNRFTELILTVRVSDNNTRDGRVHTYVSGDVWTNAVHIPYEDIKDLGNPKVTISITPVDGSAPPRQYPPTRR